MWKQGWSLHIPLEAFPHLQLFLPTLPNCCGCRSWAFTKLLSEYLIDAKPVLDLLAEDPLEKVEQSVDKGGNVDVVDTFVPHRNTFLAHVNHAPRLK